MIDNLRLQQFRSYRDESFEFEPGVNIVVGPNASGKTNLLEAVLVLARGSSYKARDVDLVQFNKPWARIDGYFGKQNRSAKIVTQENTVEKSFLLEDKPYKRLSLERTVPVVFFEPNHLQLITRGPEQRRSGFGPRSGCSHWLGAASSPGCLAEAWRLHWLCIRSCRRTPGF